MQIFNGHVSMNLFLTGISSYNDSSKYVPYVKTPASGVYFIEQKQTCLTPFFDIEINSKTLKTQKKCKN